MEEKAAKNPDWVDDLTASAAFMRDGVTDLFLTRDETAALHHAAFESICRSPTHGFTVLRATWNALAFANRLRLMEDGGAELVNAETHRAFLWRNAIGARERYGLEELKDSVFGDVGAPPPPPASADFRGLVIGGIEYDESRAALKLTKKGTGTNGNGALVLPPGNISAEERAQLGFIVNDLSDATVRKTAVQLVIDNVRSHYTTSTPDKTRPNGKSRQSLAKHWKPESVHDVPPDHRFGGVKKVFDLALAEWNALWAIKTDNIDWGSKDNSQFLLDDTVLDRLVWPNGLNVGALAPEDVLQEFKRPYEAAALRGSWVGMWGLLRGFLMASCGARAGGPTGGAPSP